ncbi:N-acetylglucosamine kinase [Kineococcus sp. SYSU DK006]|uniref:N-acetylglucosamine kinase n=1 Tax=Kineococcus sp. SYSU DK006 TaxID=3383127 RepID=UPI003D7CB16E
MATPPRPPADEPAVLLAVDAGGTSTRALVADADGRRLGHALAGTGNPRAVGVERALQAVAGAAESALAAAGVPGARVRVAVAAVAGSEGTLEPADLARALGPLGVRQARFLRVSDLVAAFRSGTLEPAGAALVAGTGSVAARVEDSRLVRVVGGSGWLLGDAGSGFWTGRRVARAAVAALDGTGPPTALVGALLAELGLDGDVPAVGGRPGVLVHVLDRLHGDDPLRLARLAPLAFRAAPADPLAADLVRSVHDALASLVVSVAGPGPLVAGGSLWRHGVAGSPVPLSPRLAQALEGVPVRSADDGLLGAAVLAVQALGLGESAVAAAAQRLREQLQDLPAPRPLRAGGAAR